MLIAAIAIWLIFFFLAVACCRAAASADRKDLALSARHTFRTTLAPPPAGALYTYIVDSAHMKRVIAGPASTEPGID
jgi:hypothetical protein